MTRAIPTSVEKITHISQGEYAIAGQPDVIIATILGSCVAACMWDPLARVGGMNHILLPDRAGSTMLDGFGASAMEQLINALLKQGAQRNRLRAKIFGGAKMIANFTDIGDKNAAFVTDYLQRENIPCDGASLGGKQARMVRFWPHSGMARQRLVERVEEEIPAVKPKANDVELF
jgi:chemotaxis protein CheD